MAEKPSEILVPTLPEETETGEKIPTWELNPDSVRVPSEVRNIARKLEHEQKEKEHQLPVPDKLKN
jgi:hypothetical protein